MAPSPLTELWNRLIDVSPIALFKATALSLGRLRLETTWNRADPFVLPGLTTLMTVFPGTEKSRLLTSR